MPATPLSAHGHRNILVIMASFRVSNMTHMVCTCKASVYGTGARECFFFERRMIGPAAERLAGAA